MRILAAASRRLDINVLRRELEQPRGDTYELFVLYMVGDRGVRARLLHTSRFWRNRHAELDGILEEFARGGVLCDGLATAGDPIEVIDRSLREFQPDEVVIARTGRSRSVEAKLEGLLQGYALASGRPIKMTWLTA